MGSRSLAGKRIVVAGASAGIGRAFAVRAVTEGAAVIMAARRGELLDEVRVKAGGGTCAAIDVRRPEDCERLADLVRQQLGGIDVLLCAFGYAPLRMMADTTPEDWSSVFETNVVGVHQVIRACLALLRPAAIVAALSSESVAQPRSALGAYSSSKAALDRLLEAWRTEHAGIRFCSVVVGATFPTDFSANFDLELLTRALDDWAGRGLAQQEFMTPEDVADVLAGTIAVAAHYPAVCLERLTLRSPSPVVGTFDGAVSGEAPG